MLSSEEVILRAALQSEVNSANAWLEYKASTPSHQLPNMLNWCGGYIYKNLLRLGIHDEYLKGIYKHNWASNTFRLQRLNGVLCKLSKITSITPIKSFGLNNKHFNLGLRSIGDFDFYFEKEAFSRLSNELIAHGFDLFMGVSEEELIDKIFTSRGSWSYKRGNIDDLDLHWKVFDEFDLKFNKTILAKNSIPHTSSWGRHLQLTNEMSSIVISHHHFLQGGDNYSGICDLKHILEQSDLNQVNRLARRLNMQDILNSQIDFYQSLIKVNSGKMRATEIKHNRGNLKHILAFVQKGTLTKPGLYKIWVILGAKSKIEKFFFKRFGVFSNPNSYMKKSIKIVETSPEMVLGLGWHYRYPGDRAQWTTYPDARVLLQSTTDKIFELEIVLEPTSWAISIPKLVECFINGSFVGTLDKNASSFNFSFKVKKGWNEISFRAKKPWIRDLKKIDFNWQRLMMPVKSIKIVESRCK